MQGNYLPNCPTYISAQPIVTNTATCLGATTINPAAASSTITAGSSVATDSSVAPDDGVSTVYLTVTVA